MWVSLQINPGESDCLAGRGLAWIQKGQCDAGIYDCTDALVGEARRSTSTETVVDLLLGRVIVGLSSADDGIVVPHPRYLIVLPLWNPPIFVCGFDRPVDLGLGNGESLTTMFVDHTSDGVSKPLPMAA